MRSLACAIAAIAWLVAPTAAAAQAPPQLDGDPQLNLQTPQMAVTFPAHFPDGPPDTWTLDIVQRAVKGSADSLARPERLVAHGSGTGDPGQFVIPVADPGLRWEFAPITDVQVDLRWTYTTGGQTQTDEQPALFLSMFHNGGRSAGAAHGGMTPIPGSSAIFTPEDPEAIFSLPPEPYHQALGAAVSAGLEKGSFLSGTKLRGSVAVPFAIPPEGANPVKARVRFPKGRNPGTGIKVYSGKASPSGQPGTAAPVMARLTAKGKKLARKIGAVKVASKLASAGAVDFYWQPRLTKSPIVLYAPIGTWFHDYQRPASHPKAQTCEPFPGMPSGFLMYTAIEIVYGSDTCTRGAPLTPVPFY